MRKYLLSILFWISTFMAYSTHQRAGEITFVHLSGNTYQFTITTYTYTPSPADRPEIEVFWGDGSSSVIERLSKTNMANNISKNIYVATHTFAAAGTYVISFEDPNRNAGILNIPNSVNIPFYIQTTLIINPFLGSNSSPQLLNPPIDNGCTNVIYYHNPGAYDADGDSLSYSLINCKGYGGEDIPNYSIPQASHSFTINPTTGDLIWDTPVTAGEYNIAILIKEWRHGILIGTITRDMQITISPCNNRPPEIYTITDTCILAGDTLTFPVLVTDPDSDNVTIEAFSPIFMMTLPAYFPTIYGSVPLTATFFWETNCNHVQRNAYTILFKATDNGYPVNLTAFKTVNVKVVAPKPKNLMATAVGNHVHLHWQPSVCTNIVGYKVFKRSGSYDFTPSHCETGLPSYAGYTLIGTTVDTVFIDDGSIMPTYHGNEYCYRVYALFADGAESYVSDETCIMLAQDAPLITHVDVNITAIDTGEIIVKWIKPYEIDTNRFAPPYWYKLYRRSSSDITWTAVATINSSDDTLYVDNHINTKDITYTYKIELYAGAVPDEQLIETSDPASSLFLTIIPKSRSLMLTWSEQVPWQNRHYIIYRYNEHTAQFDSIGYTTHRYYQDNGLQNGHSYCYYIKSEGGYFVPDTLYPNYNRSQRICQIPIDKEPPDTPVLNISTDCKTLQFDWSFINDTTTWDIASYYIYYKPYYEVKFSKIDSFIPSQCISDNGMWHYEFQGVALVAGCFALAAIDTNGNVSALSNDTCFDPLYCLDYRFPNTFSPNNDGYNDLFMPYPYTNVSKVKFVAYNRWGGIVYKTENPDVNWDGIHILTKQPVPSGTYYYTCDVFVTTLEGKQQIIPLNGTILLVRSAK